MAKAPQVKVGILLWMRKPIMSKNVFPSTVCCGLNLGFYGVLWAKSFFFFFLRAEPHYGWADVVGDSSQLLSITPRERPPGVYPNLDFGSSTSTDDDQPDLSPPSS